MKQTIRPSRGFTLIEVLVAITIMSLMAVLSWRGLDGMTRAQSQTQARADEIENLELSYPKVASIRTGVALPVSKTSGSAMTAEARESATAPSAAAFRQIVFMRNSGRAGMPEYSRFRFTES